MGRSEETSYNLVVTHLSSYHPFPACGSADSPNWNTHYHFSACPMANLKYYQASRVQYVIKTSITLSYIIHLCVMCFSLTEIVNIGACYSLHIMLFPRCQIGKFVFIT